METTLIITLIVVAAGIVLFVKEYFSVDTTSVLIMALFIVTGVLTPEEGFAGFNHPATLTLGCMFVVSAALFRSGLLNPVNSLLVKTGKKSSTLAVALFVLIAAFFSAFVNDSAIVALLLPIALKVAHETNYPPSKILIPISFASLFGGTCTLIGTSTNLLVSGYAQKYGIQPFGMFEFSVPAIILAAAGIVYLLSVGKKLLPDRGKDGSAAMTKHVHDYVTEVLLEEQSPDAGKPVKDSKLANELQANILEIFRDGRLIIHITGETVLLAGDALRVMVSPELLSRISSEKGYVLRADKEQIGLDEADERKLFEMMVPFNSNLAGRSLRSLNFRTAYGASVLALRHREATKWSSLGEVVLMGGDMLMILATQEAIDSLVNQKLLFTLSSHKYGKLELSKAIPALLIATGVVLAAALGVTSILISGLLGCLLLILTGVLKPQEAYEAIEWKVIFMMAGVLSMGVAIEKSGGARLIAEQLQASLGAYDPRIALSFVFLVCVLSTNVLSSKATAALMAPIAINLAISMGVSERPFLVAVMFACSLTFMSPVSYPTHTMIYAPGNYRFTDFMRVGAPINLIVWILASFIIPYFFPF